MTNPDDRLAPYLAEVRQAAKRRRALTTEPVLTAAAELLAEIIEAGQRRGVTRDDWAMVTSLPDACVDALGGANYQARKTVKIETATALIETAIERLGELDVSARSEGLGYAARILKHRPRYLRELIVECTQATGWQLSLAGTGRVVYIEAPYTPDGARAVADLLARVVDGQGPDPFGG